MDEAKTEIKSEGAIHHSGDAKDIAILSDTQASGESSYNSRGDGLELQSMSAQSCIAAYDDLCRRNRLLPVFRLPPELLLRIMHEFTDFDSIRTISGRYPGWLAVTHVCQIFRDLALGYPMLWTNINTKLGCRWGQEFLERSHGALLGLHIDLEIDTQFMEALRPYMDTVERLFVDTENDPGPTIAALLACCSPNLREATLLAIEYRSSHVSADILQNAPLLRDLTLRNFSIAWAHPIWPNLRSLRVDHSHRSRDFSFGGTLTDLVDCLRASPDLERLDLRLCLGPLSHPVDPLRRLICPRLTTLVMRDEIYASLAVLESIEAPHLTELDLGLLFAQMTNVYAERLANVLKAYRLPLHSALCGYEGPTYRMDAWTIPLPRTSGTCLSPWDHPKLASSPPVSIRLLGPRVAPEAAAIVFNALPLGDLRALSISPDPRWGREKGWSKDTCQCILARARCLQSLRISQSSRGLGNTAVLCRLLAMSRPHDDNAIVYLPSLTTLTLANVQIGQGYMGHPFYRKLLQFLQRRARLGAGIHTLRLENCSEASSALGECFRRVPGLAYVEYEGTNTWDEEFRIEKSDVEACMGDGPGDAEEDDALYGW